MIAQNQQSSNQYGFYAVPKAVEPRKKYRDQYEDDEEYEDEELENQNMYEPLDQEAQNQKQLDRDFYVDEAPYPQFKPKQKGLDYGVQIEKQDLFDFDLEVSPLIEILVGRSVVSAINQLQEEKEKNQRQQTLNTYQKKRNAELMVTQRLEAKSKRKKEEVDRRKLQKEIFVKNKKEATRKLISRKNAKHCLLNLKRELLSDLQQDGFLREDTYLSLRVDYQSWMYDQIKELINEELNISNSVEKMIKEKEKQIQDEHEKSINKENLRRKQILNERERIRKENQERKRKKKIRKQRLQLNQERGPDYDKAIEEIQKYEPVPKILRASNLSSGLTKRSNTAETVHVSGGLMNFLIQFFCEINSEYSFEQIQGMVEKIMSEVDVLKIDVSKEDLDKIEEYQKKMEENGIQFMKNKRAHIEQLANQLTFGLCFFDTTKQKGQKLRQHLVRSLLNISLSCVPGPKMEEETVVQSYEATDQDKKYEELKHKIEYQAQQSAIQQQLNQINSIVRVRFEQIRPQKSEEEKKEQEEGEKPIDLDQWIDIYDGEGWEHDLKGVEKQKDREGQSATSYVLPSFQSSFVFDQRNLHYLLTELSKLLEIKSEVKLQKYIKQLNEIKRGESKIPIYDVELEWE